MRDGTITPAAIGDITLLDRKTIALFCSMSCPGDIIIGMSRFADWSRETERTVIGGFHTPVEQGLLDMLLRRGVPVVVCPARGISGMRLPKAWKDAVVKGSMIIVSPFDDRHTRITANLAEKRNRFIANLADDILIAHASAGGKLERFAKELIGEGRQVWTFESEWNRGLVEMGARVVIYLKTGQFGRNQNEG
jgi:hypothetical protein